MPMHVFWLFLVAAIVLSRAHINHPYNLITLGSTHPSHAVLFKMCGGGFFSPRLARTIWRSHYFHLLTVLLLLSGDIDLNPGLNDPSPNDPPCAFSSNL